MLRRGSSGSAAKAELETGDRVGWRSISPRACSGQGRGYGVIITGQGAKNVRSVIVIDDTFGQTFEALGKNSERILF